MAKKNKATQNEAVSTEPSKLYGFITNEQLAQKVIKGVKQAEATAEDLLELRERFAKLGDDETILGYHGNEWEKFCEERLDMTPQKARYLLRKICKAMGKPTPGSKHDGSAMRDYPTKSEGGEIHDETKVEAAKPEANGWNGKLPAYNPQAKTPSGHIVGTVKSFAVWEIRQGNEKAAGYWMRQLFLAQKSVAVDPWRLLHIHAVEEVGLADLSVVRDLLDLEDTAKGIKDGESLPPLVRDLIVLKRNAMRIRDGNTELLPLMLGTALLCRAKKSRLGDNMCIYFRLNPTYVPPTEADITAMASEENPQPEYPPDHDVYDKHTVEGKAMKRGVEHFLTSSKSQIKNPSPIPDFKP